jgi:hypothetical protein
VIKTLKLSRFCQSSDTLRAEQFVNFLALFNDHHTLQVGTESPVGCMLRKTSIMTKGGAFTACFALRHFINPFEPGFN